MANGIAGKILEVDLSTGKINKLDTDIELVKSFGGGRGLGVKLLWERVRQPGLDPLSPDNPLMFLTGPLSGFGIPSAARTVVVTKNPHTSPLFSPYPRASTITYSNMGGHIGPEIKLAGYDAIIIVGRSSQPVYLKVEDDEVELCPAGHLWGKGTDETDKMLRDELNNPRFRSAYIGPAGENGVPYACIINTSARAAGRGGTGCVMGSKKLKAICIRGTGMPSVADPEGFRQSTREAAYAIRRWSSYESWRRWGTASAITSSSDNGTQAVWNYREGTFPEAYKIGAVAAEQKLWIRNLGCFYCPVGCRKSGVIRSGPYKGLTHDGPEYETGTMLGANCGLSDLYPMMKVISVVDDMGLDAISIGNVIGFLMEAYDKKLVDKKFLDGIELPWGSVEGMLAVIQKVAHQHGVGKLLSLGVKAISEQIGGDSHRWAIQTKGNEFAAWNVHTSASRALGYATANRGACHLNGSSIASQNAGAAIDSLGLCRFTFGGVGLPRHLKLLRTITGWGWSEEEFITVGERIYNLERCFNVREGFRRQDDYIPQRFHTEPLTMGPKKGSFIPPEEYEKLLDDYYHQRGWDPTNGVPTRQKLQSIGLALAAEELGKLGFYGTLRE